MTEGPNGRPSPTVAIIGAGFGGICMGIKLKQALLISRLHLRRDPHMYPYSARRPWLLGRLLGLLYGRGRRD